MEGWVGEEREDVDELDALDWEIGEGAKGGLKPHLCTGELGGTGGMGGGLGLLSRGGIVVGGRVAWC